MGKLPLRETTAAEEALQSSREVIDLSLEMKSAPGELDCGLLSEVLASLQQTICALDPRWLPEHKKMPGFVSEDNSFHVTGLYEPGFGIRMKSRHAADLFGGTPAAETARGLAELVVSSGNLFSLQEKLRSLHPRVLSPYLRLLEAAVKNKAALQLDWGSPGHRSLSAALSADQLLQACRLIQEKRESTAVLWTTGSLTAINLKRGTFQLQGEDGTPYSGSLSADIKREAAKGYKFEVPMRVKAELEVKTTFSMGTGTEQAAYKLLSFNTRVDEELTEEHLQTVEMLGLLQLLHGRLEAAVHREGYAGQVDEGSAPLTAKDYAELRDIIRELDEGGVPQSLLQALDAGDTAAILDLLEPDKPIDRLARSTGLHRSGPGAAEDFYMDEDADPEARAELAEAAQQLRRLESEAYDDLRTVFRRLGHVIEALQQIT